MGNPYAPPGSPDRPGGGDRDAARPGDPDGGRREDPAGGGRDDAGRGRRHDADSGADGNRSGRDRRGGSAPGRGPGRAGAPAQLSPTQARRLAALVGRFALLVLASLLTARLPLPWSVAAPVFGGLGFVAGVAALRSAVGTRTGGAMPVALGISLGMTAVILLQQVLVLALWPISSDLQECRERAVTATAERACQDDYERRIRDLSRLPTG